ncbi:MAG: SDR family NAD(P)-dependent oxidoreductase [Rhodoferax sp.]|nr:SDR family NAD(P)-dependent oxidoreductase [Rhodoferax sp.]
MVQDIVAAGGKAQAFVVDLTNQEQVIACVAAIEVSLGPIDVLVNNAGWDRAGNFLKTDKALWEQIIAINLYGSLYMHHAVLKGIYTDILYTKVDGIATITI